jgi:hypothetical protein
MIEYRSLTKTAIGLWPACYGASQIRYATSAWQSGASLWSIGSNLSNASAYR